MKQLVIAPVFICILAFACSNSLKEEKPQNEFNNESVRQVEEPSSDRIVAKNMEPAEETEEVIQENPHIPVKIKKPVKPVIEEINQESVNSGETIHSSGNNNAGIKKESPQVADEEMNNGTSQNSGSDNMEIVPEKTTVSHEVFDELLRTYVSSSGGVDYDGFRKNKSKLGGYLDMLKKNAPQSSWSKEKEMAYWINMYNAFTIYSILEKYPVSSIMDIEGGKIWDNKKIVVGGKSLTLNMIEKEKLLKRFKEPRVHFAVNCAAASCPPLLNKAWTEDNIKRYFSKRAKAFINNSKYNTLSEKTVEVSQIFNWYAGDFGGSDKVLSYIKKYADTEISSSAKVKFREYNWKLNKK